MWGKHIHTAKSLVKTSILRNTTYVEIEDASSSRPRAHSSGERSTYGQMIYLTTRSMNVAIPLLPIVGSSSGAICLDVG